jgi:microcystin-dependent protein
MSRRQSVPANTFYLMADPMPPLFSEPHTGDTYFNTIRKALRIFYEEEWHDVTGEVYVGPEEPLSEIVEWWIDTTTGSAKYRDPDTGDFVLLIDGSFSGISVGEADARYVNIAGDAMTGLLALSGNPTTPMGASTKQYADSVVPIGSVLPYAGLLATIPAGWFACQGQEVNRTTYATLFTTLGSGQYYGVGNGSSTFNLPDLQTRIPVGYSMAGGTFSPLGQKGGAETHTLTIDQMPSHAHQWTGVGLSALNIPTANNDDFVGGDASTGVTGPANPEVGNGIKPRGGGLAHNNLQPFIVMHFIIKAL